MRLIACGDLVKKMKVGLNHLKYLKLTTIFLLVICTYSVAEGFSQKVSISKNNISLQEVFKQIKKQAGYTFVYKEVLLANAKKVSLNLVNATVAEVLDETMKEQLLTYSIINRLIVIKEKPVQLELVTMVRAPVFAPVITITGKVTSDKQEPLSGASIAEKGTSNAVSTKDDGSFSINVANTNAKLIVTYVGFESTEVAVAGQSNINISLVPANSNLSDVVVVGYGTQKKVNLTGAVSTVSSEQLTSRPVGQTSAALQGVAPGVTVVQSSGRPGGDAGTVRIRGIGTLGDSNPLVLIDGIEGSMNNIDPNAIETISVLKDAASASIYGSRAANGVVLITTKRAKSNLLSIGYNGYAGVQTPTNLPKMANAIDHMILTNEAYVNVGRTPLYSDALIEKYRTDGPSNPDLYPNTDWQKEVLTGSGLQHGHFLSLNGGSEKIRFLTSLGYIDQKGIIENSGFKRFTLRNNADLIFSDKFNIRFDVQLVGESTVQPGRGSSEVFHWMNRIPANQLGANSNGTWGEGWNGDNPIAFSRNGGTQKNTAPAVFANVSVNYRPVSWLRAEITAAPRYQEYINTNFNRSIQTYKPDGTISFLTPARSSLTEDANRAFYNNFRGTLTFDKTFGDHSIKLLAGASREDYKNNFVSAFRDGFILPDYPVLNTGSADNQRSNGNGAEWALQSFFGRLNYDYKSKYLFEVNGRYDGSSRFAQGNKYGFFPSVSAGWRISEEPFMEPIKDVLNEFKLRGSWGRLGNQNIGNYPFTSFVNLGSYTIGGQIVNVAALNTLANTDISWETTEMSDIGVDITLFKNLSLTADYYFRQTRDILYTLDVPLIIGLSAPQQNVGVVNNKGWELGINYRGSANEFKYSIGFNLSDVQNKVIDLRGVNRTGLTVNREGSPIGSIFGLQSLGFFQNDQEVAAHAKQFGTVKPGDIKYKDQNNDGLINDNDNIVIGSTIPRYTFGTTLNGSWKGFNINLFIQGVGKADGYLYQQGIMPFFLGGTVQEQHKDHWTPKTPDATFPRLAFSESNNEKNSSFWLKDASYVRIKNLQIGYTVPARITSAAHIRELRFYVNAQNFFTRDRFWKGYDVESPVGVGNTYPQVKLFSFGLNANF